MSGAGGPSRIAAAYYCALIYTLTTMIWLLLLVLKDRKVDDRESRRRNPQCMCVLCAALFTSVDNVDDFSCAWKKGGYAWLPKVIPTFTISQNEQEVTLAKMSR